MGSRSQMPFLCFHFSVEQRNDPICKIVFVLVFRLEWKNSEYKTENKTALRVKTLDRKF